MALLNQVFTPGNPPNHSAELMQIALNRPNIYKAFSQGYDDAQKRQLALEQYKQAKMKTDLAAALYPDLLRSQQMALQARVAAYGAPTPYSSSPSAVTPVNTRRDPVAAPVGGPVTVNSQGVPVEANPLLRDPGLNSSFDPNAGIVAPPINPTVPGGFPGITTADTSDYTNSYAGDPGLDSPYSAGDFLA